jgi:alpha-galactosidase
VLDNLLNEFPALEIDNANWRVTGPDIEMMSRTLGSLTRSELTSGGLPHPIQDQAQTQELSLWIPLSANLLHGVDPYNFRSTATTGVGIGLDLSSPYIDTTELAAAIAEVKELRPFWLGDYYPMTAITQADNDWSGWQFDRPDLGAGYAVLFRRPKSELPGMNLKLQNLVPAANYRVSVSEGFDKVPEQLVTGEKLMNLPVEIRSAPGSVVVRYRRAP